MKIASWVSKMTGMSMKLDSLQTVLVMQLQDLYSAEDQLISALPKMAEAAYSPRLKEAFLAHLLETRGHKKRLEECFRALGEEPKMETCEAMQGLIEEGDEIAHLDGEPEVRDAAIIAAAQRVEHYEMAGYGCVRSFAQRLGHKDVAKLLQQTLDEEANADSLLTRIAVRGVNVQASHV